MKIALFEDGPCRYNRLRVLALIVYAVLVIFGVLHHEPMSDEADPWVMVRDADFHDFIHYFAYAGHPPLWYALLLPFARAGLPFETMAVINALISFTVAWLILFRLPFSLWFGLLFLFSQTIAYQFSVVARGYMLMTLILFLIPVAYPARLDKPMRYGVLLALLFNSEGFAIIPAATLSAYFAWECFRQPNWFKRYATALAIIGGGGILTLAALWPPADMEGYKLLNHYYSYAFPLTLDIGFLPLSNIDALANAYITVRKLDVISYNPVPVWAMAMPGVAIILLAVLYLRNTFWLFFFLSLMGWVYFIVTYKYPAAYLGDLLPIFTITALWLRGRQAPGFQGRLDKALCSALAVCLGLVFAIGDSATIVRYREDYALPYCGGKDMAEFIRDSGYEHRVIASLVCPLTTAVSAYLPHTEFWIMGQNRVARYMTWNDFFRCMDKMNSVSVKSLSTDAQRNPLILSSAPLNAPAGLTLQLLHYSPTALATTNFPTDYYLYSISAEKPGR